MDFGSSGLVLVDQEGTVVYASAQAISILSYPGSSASKRELTDYVRRELLASVPPEKRAQRGGFSVTFRTAERMHVCRGYPMESLAGRDSLLALLVEPLGGTGDLQHVLQMFSLTDREAEVLHYLVLGLTNKEIGERMRISPNTVKAFLKLVMIKMGVGTRAAIVGRLLGSERLFSQPVGATCG